MIKYVFKEDAAILHGGVKDADPQKVGEALEKIADANGGRLTPRDTVEAARMRRHPLHRFFEWNNDKAADKHRLHQARHLIAAVRIIDDEMTPPKPVYAYVSIVADKGAGRAYVPQNTIITNAWFQSLALKQAERDLAALEARYRMIADFCVAIREWRERLSERRRQLLEDPPPAPMRDYGT